MYNIHITADIARLEREEFLRADYVRRQAELAQEQDPRAPRRRLVAQRAHDTLRALHLLIPTRYTRVLR